MSAMETELKTLEARKAERAALVARKYKAEAHLKSCGWSYAELDAFCDSNGATLEDYVDALEVVVGIRNENRTANQIRNIANTEKRLFLRAHWRR